MDDKIKLLMETTGCNQYEADLAFKSAKGNFAEALDFLNRVSPGLGIIKGKFIVAKKFIYGAFQVIFDIKQRNVITTSAIVSENPGIYELNLESQWEDVGRAIYSFRLEDGALPDYSNMLQEKVADVVEKATPPDELAAIGERLDKILGDIFASDEIIKNIEYSEETYKTQTSLADKDMNAAGQNSPSGKIVLSVEPLKDENGVAAVSLKESDVIWVKITDSREVAEYLAERLGGRSEGKILPLACQITSVKKAGPKVELAFKFTETIKGITEIDAGEKIKVVSRQDSGKIAGWWKKLFNI